MKRGLDRIRIDSVADPALAPDALIRLPSSGAGARTDATLAAVKEVRADLRASALAGLLRCEAPRWPAPAPALDAWAPASLSAVQTFAR
jgi:hypothetical protein